MLKIVEAIELRSSKLPSKILSNYSSAASTHILVEHISYLLHSVVTGIMRGMLANALEIWIAYHYCGNSFIFT